MIADIGSCPFSADCVALRFIKELTIRPNWFGFATVSFPVAKLFTVIRRVTIGLRHQCAGWRKKNGLFERGHITNQPWREDQKANGGNDGEIPSNSTPLNPTQNKSGNNERRAIKEEFRAQQPP